MTGPTYLDSLWVNSQNSAVQLMTMSVIPQSGELGKPYLVELGAKNPTTLTQGTNELLVGYPSFPLCLRRQAMGLVNRILDGRGFPFRNLRFRSLWEDGGDDRDHLFRVFVKSGLGNQAIQTLTAMGAEGLSSFNMGDRDAVLGMVRIPVVLGSVVMLGIATALEKQQIDFYTMGIDYLGIRKP